MAVSFNTRRYYKGGRESTESLVRRVLSKSPAARNNDKTLYMLVQRVVLRREGEINDQSSADEFVQAVIRTVLPSAKSVRDWRDRLQKQGLFQEGDPAVRQTRAKHRAAGLRVVRDGSGRCDRCGESALCQACDRDMLDALVHEEVSVLQCADDWNLNLRLEEDTRSDDDSSDEHPLDEAA